MKLIYFSAKKGGFAMPNTVFDLRSALALLQQTPGQLLETHEEVDPEAELSGIYRYVGAGGTVKRPTKEGPAMLFHNVKGHPDAKVAIGLLASRKRVGLLLDCPPRRAGKTDVSFGRSSHSARPDRCPCPLSAGGPQGYRSGF
jgi:3-polyprenyl-4-hydroxybenzoate decarboxylase